MLLILRALEREVLIVLDPVLGSWLRYLVPQLLAKRTSQRLFAIMDSNNKWLSYQKNINHIDASRSATRSRSAECHHEKLIDVWRGICPLGTMMAPSSLRGPLPLSRTRPSVFELVQKIEKQAKKTSVCWPGWSNSRSTPYLVATAATTSGRGWRETCARSSLLAI